MVYGINVEIDASKPLEDIGFLRRGGRGAGGVSPFHGRFMLSFPLREKRGWRRSVRRGRSLKGREEAEEEERRWGEGGSRESYISLPSSSHEQGTRHIIEIRENKCCGELPGRGGNFLPRSYLRSISSRLITVFFFFLLLFNPSPATHGSARATAILLLQVSFLALL